MNKWMMNMLPNLINIEIIIYERQNKIMQEKLICMKKIEITRK